MNKEQKHTALPWKVEHCKCGDSICGTYTINIGCFYNGSGFSLSDAEFIVKACNSHYKLVEACIVALEHHNRDHGKCTDCVVYNKLTQALKKAESR